MPEIKLREATLEESIQYLRVKTAELDTFEPDLARRGVNFIIQGASAEQKAKKITLELRNVPLKDVVETIAKMTGMKMRLDSFAVVLLPLDAPNQMHTRIYRVPPDFLQAVGR